jgi:hypothetical protein
MKERYVIGLTLLGTSVIFLAIFLFTINGKMPENQAMPWESQVNAQQKTEVFGLVVGVSKVIDAARIFGTEIEASLFEDKTGEKELEVFFSNTKVGGISASIILNLSIDNPSMQELLTNIDKILLMPSGVKKTTFSPVGDRLISNLTIQSLSFIPKADLDEKVIKKLFGNPASIDINTTSDDSLSYWHYPNKGLRVIISAKLNEIFEFYNP